MCLTNPAGGRADQIQNVAAQMSAQAIIDSTQIKAALSNVPGEIFTQICSHLEPIWLWNLSHVCYSIYQGLTWQNGNFVWYSAMPYTLWKEAEQFQDTKELQAAMIDDEGSTDVPIRALILRSGVSHTQFSPTHFVLRSHPGPPPTAPLPPLPQHSNWTSTRNPAHDVSPVRASFPSLIARSRGDRLRGGRREPVKVLGAAYNPNFNYKREILGHLQSDLRCYVCLDLKSDRGNPVRCRRWGLLWCSSCFTKYTITPSALHMLHNSDHVLAAATLRFFRSGSATPRFYLPEVNDLVRQQSGLDLQTHTLIVKQCRFVLEANRVQKSTVEARRRNVRLKIIDFAKMIWDGVDPDPDSITTNGVLSLRDRPHLSSPSTYLLYRRRFAPTAELGKFLFPDYLLSEEPRDLPYDPSTGWLSDPTVALPRKTAIEHLNRRWFSDAAESMLSYLTCWMDPRYDTKGFGGSVSAWVEAAVKYHTCRLEAEVDSGRTVSIGWASTSSHGDREFRRIRKLRAKCGLQAEGQVLMPTLPPLIEVDDFSNPLTSEQYIAWNHYAMTFATDRMKQMEDFNKIIKRTCVGCPATGMTFHPMGVDGLLKHMLYYHPNYFWITDDFHIIG